MSVDIFATSKEIAEELEFVARWACAGDDIFDLRPSIERIASFQNRYAKDDDGRDDRRKLQSV